MRRTISTLPWLYPFFFVPRCFSWTTTISSGIRPPTFLSAKSSSSWESDDWREFRAKLIAGQTGTSSSAGNTNYAYVTNALIEKGSVLLSRVESSLGCHDLRQPYFHKAAVLLLEHDQDSSRGIVLNRRSNLVCSDGDIMLLDGGDEEVERNPNNAWPMNFGGDIAGLFSDEPMIVALHRLGETSSMARDVSDLVLPNLWVTSHSGARSLVAAGEATCEDFVSFYGFSLWEPGQLLTEVERGSWHIVSMDSDSIWQQLQQPLENPQEAGLACWENWTTRIGKAKEEQVEESRNAFSDLILKEWCREMLCVDDEDDDNFVDIFQAMQEDKATIKAGSLVRATGNPETFRLFDQLFHKSTILLLKEDPQLSLGLILNLPTTDAYLHTLPDGTEIPIPIRYGGPLGQDEDDDDDYNLVVEEGASRIIWLHCNAELRDLKVGKAIGASSPIWTCSQIQALNAMDMGLASPNDFLAIQGYVVWEKEMGAGGIAGEIVAGSFESVPAENVDKIWSILGSQTSLEDILDVKSTFISSEKAWSMGGSGAKDEVKDAIQLVYNTTVSLPDMADEALRKWIEIFLLDNRKYVPF